MILHYKGYPVAQVSDPVKWVKIPCWIDINKQKPEHGQEILITDGIRIAGAVCDLEFSSSCGIYFDPLNGGGYDFRWDIDTDKITHWMTLPELPRMEPFKCKYCGCQPDDEPFTDDDNQGEIVWTLECPNDKCRERGQVTREHKQYNQAVIEWNKMNM